MVTKVVFLLALFGVASSELLHKRRCDPVGRDEEPTLCSNYENTEQLDKVQTEIKNQQARLEQRIEAIEGRTRLHFESANSNISALQSLVTHLSSALKDLERMKIQTETEFKDAKTHVEENKADIASLKKEVQELVEHRERAGGNFSKIEKKLEATERKLSDERAKLENLETETEAAFSETQRLLNLYKNELSHLNTTAHELKVEVQMDAANKELEATLKKVQNDSEGLSAKLIEQKAEVDKFKDETYRKFSDVNKQLKTQKTKVDHQKTDIDTLKSGTTGIKTRLGSTEKKLLEQNKLKLALSRISAKVNAKVAFSATVYESPHVFTGPAITRNILIFDRAFTNIGNAYNCKTGIFTAPLKGFYHFSFMTFGYSSHSSGAILLKNGHLLVYTWESKGADVSDTTSNAVILELNVRDTVSISLWKGGKVHASVFSGFLIFPTS